tara:strand:- start:8323 stop:8562 length:240 start_codon:yes stop_codon:yes gene_type:complete
MSTLTVKYFGAIAEVTDTLQEELDIMDDMSVQSVVDACLQKYPRLQTMSFKVAHNQKITDSGETAPGDEIAFLPPFSGG